MRIKSVNHRISKKIHHRLSNNTTIVTALFSITVILTGSIVGLPLLQQKQAYASVIVPSTPSQSASPPPPQLSSPNTPTNQPLASFAPICNPQSPILQSGSTGAKVVELQIFLTQLGYGPLLGQKGIDGKYAIPTQNAVKKFQQDNRLQPIDGKVGPKTWSALCSAISNRQQQQPQPQQTAAPLKKYNVIFRYVDVFNHRDTRFGTGEWKLTAFVNDKQVLLDSCSPSRPGGSGGGCTMQNVEDNHRYTPNIRVPISVGEKGVILIRVGGVELDAEAWKPVTVPPELKMVLNGIATGIGIVSENPLAGPAAKAAVKHIDDIIALGGAVAGHFDKNDILGTVSINDRGPAFEKSYNERSSLGDYALGVDIEPCIPRYSIRNPITC